jgi:phage gp46-like protein
VATSSALQLADLALLWDEVLGFADLSIIDGDLASDTTMITAALLSLFLDRRAFDDDVPPSGEPDDRRGWWADEFADNEGDLIGSRLWLLDRAAFTRDIGPLAEEYSREALAWFTDDNVASKVDLEIDTSTNGRLFIGGTIHRHGRKAVSFRFAHVWDNL